MAGKPKHIYLPGETYGWLTVVGDGDRKDKHGRYIKVRCRCGRIYDTLPSTFRRDDCKCFHCANKQNAQLRSTVIVGNRYGEIDVLNFIGISEKGDKQYLCKCHKCGSTSIRNQYSILHYGRVRCASCVPDFHFQIDGEIAIGTLPSGDKFIIDSEDVQRVSKFHWYKQSDQQYILCDRVNGKRARLHRFLLGVDDENFVVDHINRNPLDCRKANLRIATQAQNCLNKGMRNCNTSGFIGVSQCRNGDFEAEICLGGHGIRIGVSPDPVICAQMRNYAQDLLFREFSGERNDVPPIPEMLKKQVEAACAPYQDLADEITGKCVLDYDKAV